MARLPTPGSDNGTWGSVLNDFLAQVHAGDGLLKSGVVGQNQLADDAVTITKLDSALQDTVAKADTALQAVNNLSEVTPATARTNLGLGSAATMTPTSLAADTAFRAAYAPIAKASIKNNLLAEVGDSIASYGTGGPVDVTSIHYPGHLAAMCALSMGRIQWGGNYSGGGARITDVLSSQLPALLAQSIRPGACIVQIGANDLAASSGAGWSLASTATAYGQILTQLTAAGIVPVLWMVTPSGTNATIRTNIATWNTYLARLAQTSGYPIIDAHRPVVDPATGSFKTGYDINDGVHPSPLGHMAIARSVIAKGFADLFPPNGSFHGVMHTSDTTSYLVTPGAGLFLTGSGGIGTGWSIGNSPDSWTPSLVAPSAGDDLLGQWQQIERTTAATKEGWLFAPLPAVVSNNLYELSFRFQAEGYSAATMAANSGYSMYVRWTSPSQAYGINTWRDDVTDGRMIVRVRPTTNGGAGYLYIQPGYPTAGGPIKFRVGEVSLRNLTALGIAS